MTPGFGRVLGVLLVLLGGAGTVLGAQEGTEGPEVALRKLKVAPGLQVELFASDPMFVNPVAISIDEKGRVYVAETHRRFTSVYEVDGHPDWLEEDLAARTVGDRVAIYRRHLGDKAGLLAIESERIRRLEDRSGTGRADHAVTFAEGFNSLSEGLGSSLVARGDEVWYTCVPNLWRLRDAKGTGEDAERQLLHTGYGVHIGSGAHDLHGLTFGPDGKIYFSIGDRGLHVESGGKIFDCPDAGAVLRSNVDGSELELFATGLRNPEHLAFDRYGNLFTGDNNSDYGDEVRWLYVVEGGEYGWRYGYQHLVQKSPWMQERLWALDAGTTAPYLLPPVGHLGHGPSGVAYAPGVGLPEGYNDHFFMCDFPGGVHALALRPKGAGFEISHSSHFLWELWPTDVQIGPDGAVYISDWVHGWPKSEKGRLYRVFDPNLRNDPAVLEAKKRIAEGAGGRSLEELADALGHRDQRVRLAAQGELARRGASLTLAQVAARTEASEMARIHAIWGLGQLKSIPSLLPLLDDAGPEIRAQAAKVLGDLRAEAAAGGLIRLLGDPAPRARFFSAIAVGKLGCAESVEPLLEMVRKNADQDPFLRHAGVMGLLGAARPEVLLRASKDPSKSVRLAVLLCLRRLSSPEISRFLDDPEASIVVEAARAIYDVPIAPALPALASLISRESCPPQALGRALSANFRLGTPPHAEALATLALRPGAPEAVRIEALEDLTAWASPPVVDPVVGLWRPMGSRDPSGARQALLGRIGALLEDRSEAIRVQAIRLSGSLGIDGVRDRLLALVERDPISSVRVSALAALGAMKDPRLADALEAALGDRDQALRKEAVRWLPESGRPDAAGLLARLARDGESTPLRQSAIAGLGRLRGAEGEATLESLLDQLLGGRCPPPLVLDLLEAAASHPGTGIRDRLARFEAGRKKDDPLAAYRESLEGGDVEAGRKIFFERTQVSCVRCHKVKSRGGEVGPPLTTVAAQKPRDYLLESILLPNKVIAQGYGQEVVATESGAVEVGRVEKETPEQLVLVLADGNRKILAKKDIRARKTGLSAMPEGLVQFLTKRELRDLVEFLASLK